MFCRFREADLCSFTTYSIDGLTHLDNVLCLETVSLFGMSWMLANLVLVIKIYCGKW